MIKLDNNEVLVRLCFEVVMRKKELKVVIAVVVAVASFEGQHHILRTATQKKIENKTNQKVSHKKIHL